MMNKMMTKSCSSWQHLYEQRFSDSYSAFTHILFKSSNSILTTALRDSLSLSSCSFASGLLCCGFDLIFVPSSILINNTTRAMSRWANLMRNNDNVPFNPFHLLPFAFVFSNALGDPAMPFAFLLNYRFDALFHSFPAAWPIDHYLRVGWIQITMTAM